MSWQFNLYAAIYFITAAVSAAVSVYAWRRRPRPGASQLAWVMAAGAEWALASGLEAAAVGITAKVFWSQVVYLGSNSGPVLFFLFAWAYSHPERTLTRRTTLLISVIPALTFLMAATNGWHHLVWSSFTPSPAGNNILVYHHGVWFFFAVAYFYLLIAVGTFIIARATVRLARPYRGQAATILVGAAMPLVTSALYIAGLSPVPGLDISPLGFMLGGMALTWGILQFRLFDLVPVARDLLFASMSDGAVVLDAQNRIVEINPAAQQLLTPMVTLVGRNAQEVLATRPDLIEYYRDIMDGQGEIAVGGEPPRYLDLRISPVHDRQGRVTGRLVVLRDITERKLSEEALRQSEAVYRAMFVKNQAIKLLIDPETAVIVDANEAACRFYGYSLEQIKTKRIADINLLSEPEVYAAMERARGEARSQFFFRHRLASGEVREVEVYSSPIAVQGRTLLFSIIHDITERKRAEEALQRSNLELQGRNEELDAFAQTVAHDLKTPLNVIAGYAEVLAELAADQGDPDMRHYTDTIVAGVGKMVGIVNSLLLLASARQASVPVGELQMAEIELDAQRRLAGEIDARAAELVLPAYWPAAVGYAPWISEVWYNYLSNAIKYGGRPDVTPPTPPRVEIDAETLPDGFVRFTVRDNGCGIAPEEVGRLFRPFNRLGNGGAPGHGLGLSIVRRIVERLGGQVGVESVPGQGSLFYFTLPARSPAEQESTLSVTGFVRDD